MILKSVFGGSAQNPRANMSGGGFSLRGGQDCSGQSPSQCQWAGKGFTMVTISLSHDSTMLSWFYSVSCSFRNFSGCIVP